MGTGAAVIMPATLSLLVATFPRAERARAITAWSATSGLAIALGPLTAGWLLQSHSWHSTFLINLPVAAVAILAALVLVPPSRAEGTGRPDVLGGLLSMVTVGALVYMIIEGPHFGWGRNAITAAVVAAAGLAAFVAWELRCPHPMLNLGKFRDRAFTGAALAVLLFFFGAFGTLYYVTQHLQFVLGYSPLATGGRLLPLAGAVFAGAALTGRLTPRLGIKPVVLTGMVLGTAGIFLLTGVGDGSGYAGFLPTLILLGVAIGLSAAPGQRGSRLAHADRPHVLRAGPAVRHRRFHPRERQGPAGHHYLAHCLRGSPAGDGAPGRGGGTAQENHLGPAGRPGAGHVGRVARDPGPHPRRHPHRREVQRPAARGQQADQRHQQVHAGRAWQQRPSLGRHEAAHRARPPGARH
jgi:predicted MFS family arabinose efflux permease